MKTNYMKYPLVALYIKNTNHSKLLMHNFLAYDFMIIKLLKSLKLCPDNFARLPTPDMVDQLLTGKTLLASGWGAIIKINRERAKELASNPDEDIPQSAFPDHLRAAEVPYLPNKICQKRYHDFFTKEYPNIKGTKNTLANSLNFESTSGSDQGASMLCASFCDKDDISECKEDLLPSGTCVGDSGCKNKVELLLLSLISETIF